jgi:DNA-binding winged helix-turn-helix (wHTH) protein
MIGPENRLNLAQEPDFDLAALRVQPSTCRVSAGDAEERVEAKAMSVLVVLARAKGATVTRADLVDACWEGRIVSDDAVSRTITKVRALARLATPAAFTLETVPKVGYRLLAADVASGAAQSAPAKRAASRRWIPFALAGAGLVVVAVSVLTAASGALQAPNLPPPAYQVRGGPAALDVQDALLALDEPRVALYLRQGWDPNWLLDSEGNASLHNLMMACERNPGHDQAKVVNVARLLVEAGEDPNVRNRWGDSPLDIASARRYCGPDHPVVAYLRTVSTTGR